VAKVKKTGLISLIVVFMVSGLISSGAAREEGVSLENRDIIEKLVRLKEGQKGLHKRIDDVSRRIDDLRTELKGDIN